MKKSKFKIETLVFSLVLATNLIVPVTMNGQGSRADGFFTTSSNDYENRGVDINMSGSITNNSFDAPVGSGLLIMTAAAIGYLLVKKRRTDCRLYTCAIVFLMLILGLTQCKKNQAAAYYSDEVRIELRVGDGAKTNVNPVTGEVNFEDGDDIIVANNGKYVGKLVYDAGMFSGTITNPSTTDYLHFYHLGNRDTGTLTAGKTTSCSVSIADQAVKLPVISYAPSNEMYDPDITTYTAQLQNKCALVKFNVTTLSPFAGTCIKGMNNMVTVDFASASFTYGSENDGKITLGSGCGARWAVLLPQDAVGEGEDGSAFSGIYKGRRGAVPEIHENGNVSDGIPVVANEKFVPTGAKHGFFTVNSEGRQVLFSTGILVGRKRKSTLRFVEQQYGLVKTSNLNLGPDYRNYSDIEHFAWGESGFNHGAAVYQPWLTTDGNENYYAYGDPNMNLYDGNGMADWGYGAITNGGMAYKQWRSLTVEEINYILYSREKATEKFAYGRIDTETRNYNGLILLPDDWTDPYPDCFTAGILQDYTVNVYDLDEWAQMEENGAVFLTCGGRRCGTSTAGVGLIGFYWTSSLYDNDYAYCLAFHSTGFEPMRLDDRSHGCSIRLVTE